MKPSRGIRLGHAEASFVAALILLPFNRAGHKSADKEALEREKDDERKDHAQEGSGGEQVPILTLFSHHGRQGARDHTVFIAEEHQSHQIVVPYPEELENGETGQSRNGKGKYQPYKTW